MSMYGNPQEYETIGISIINLTEYFIKSLVEYMLVMLDIKHNCFIRIENQIGCQKLGIAKKLKYSWLGNLFLLKS